jgi:YVTN family beta-propeller protein
MGVRHVQVGHLPCATLGAAGAVWVALYGDNAVRRIDPATLKVSAPITTGAQPCGMAYGGGSVWVEDYGDNTVTRIDPATDATRMYDVGKAPYDVTFAFGAAWTSNFNDGTVSRIDAASGSIRTVTVGNSPTGIMHAGDSVWVTNQSDGTVSRIDPTGRHVRTVTVGGRVAWTAADGHWLWIGSLTNGGPGQSVQIDAAIGKVVRRSPIGPTPNDPDVLDGGVWWPDKNGSLYRVGEQDGAVTGPWPLGAANPFVAAAFDHRLWIAAFGGSDVVVVDPTRLPPS